jgi:ATP-dependent Clp protease ATP-binding subunit ClpC
MDQLPPHRLLAKLISHEGSETLPRFASAIPRGQFTREASFALIRAKVAVRDTHQAMAGTEHLLIGILRRPYEVLSALFETGGVNLESLLGSLEAALPIGAAEHIPDPLPVTSAFQSVLSLAVEESAKRKLPQVGVEHLLLAILHEGSGLANQVLAGHEITYERVQLLLP